MGAWHSQTEAGLFELKRRRVGAATSPKMYLVRQREQEQNEKVANEENDSKQFLKRALIGGNSRAKQACESSETLLAIPGDDTYLRGRDRCVA